MILVFFFVMLQDLIEGTTTSHSTNDTRDTTGSDVLALLYMSVMGCMLFCVCFNVCVGVPCIFLQDKLSRRNSNRYDIIE